MQRQRHSKGDIARETEQARERESCKVRRREERMSEEMKREERRGGNRGGRERSEKARSREKRERDTAELCPSLFELTNSLPRGFFLAPKVTDSY